MKAAVANAKAWRSTYNTEKDKLVAALERFEADYNDAENGALDYMNKSRWETAIAKAQAAAVAKDDLTSYERLTTATAELTAALDAATVSVDEYADHRCRYVYQRHSRKACYAGSLEFIHKKPPRYIYRTIIQ